MTTPNRERRWSDEDHKKCGNQLLMADKVPGRASSPPRISTVSRKWGVGMEESEEQEKCFTGWQYVGIVMLPASYEERLENGDCEE